MPLAKEIRRKARHKRIRKKVIGTPDRPRLSICRSSKHLYGQLIDDMHSRTLYAFSTLDKAFKAKHKQAGNVAAATQLGELVGPALVKKGWSQIVLDRGGWPYHGRIKALAEALRQQGLKF